MSAAAGVGIAALYGASAVALGAFGAHGLRSRVAAELLVTWETAAHYHQLHAVALLALALFTAATGKATTWPTALIAAGTLVFSGSLYLLVLTGQRWLGAITPLGGVLLIAGWLSLFGLVRVRA